MRPRCPRALARIRLAPTTWTVALLGCTPPAALPPGNEVFANNGDSADTTDVEPSDTGETTSDTALETGDTAIDPDASVLSASVTYYGIGLELACSATTGGTFEHTYDDALGNVAGRVACANAGNGEVQITFTRGSTGEWQDPDDGVDFTWTASTGEKLGYYEPKLVATGWSMSFSRFEQLDTRTILLEATFSAEFGDPSGGTIGAVDGTTVATLTCTNCP